MQLHRSFQLIVILFLITTPLVAQVTNQEKLPYLMAELTAPDFIKAVELAEGTCVIPAGIMEKHGAHLPLSTDLLLAREISSRAAELEYTLVFPEYYFGQIFEAKHQPGTIAYTPELIWKILEETCEELSRNGIKKIVIVNGHGGNNHFFSYFCQSQLAARKDYLVVFFQPDDSEINQKINPLRETSYGGHADEVETSMVYAIRPDLVHANRAGTQSGESLGRLSHMPYTYTGIWWYANYPNHYAGDGSSPQKEIGELKLNSRAKQLSHLIKKLKEDDSIFHLQERFDREAENPLKTEQ